VDSMRNARQNEAARAADATRERSLSKPL
jgi:hypothetical protein